MKNYQKGKKFRKFLIFNSGIGICRRLLRRARRRDLPRRFDLEIELDRVGLARSRAAAEDVHHFIQTTLRNFRSNRFSKEVRTVCKQSSRR